MSIAADSAPRYLCAASRTRAATGGQPRSTTKPSRIALPPSALSTSKKTVLPAALCSCAEIRTSISEGISTIAPKRAWIRTTRVGSPPACGRDHARGRHRERGSAVEDRPRQSGILRGSEVGMNIDRVAEPRAGAVDMRGDRRNRNREARVRSRRAGRRRKHRRNIRRRSVWARDLDAAIEIAVPGGADRRAFFVDRVETRELVSAGLAPFDSGERGASEQPLGRVDRAMHDHVVGRVHATQHFGARKAGLTQHLDYLDHRAPFDRHREHRMGDDAALARCIEVAGQRVAEPRRVGHRPRHVDVGRDQLRGGSNQR